MNALKSVARTQRVNCLNLDSFICVLPPSLTVFRLHLVIHVYYRSIQFVTFDMEGTCIYHFVQWQIHPFISKGTLNCSCEIVDVQIISEISHTIT